MVGHDEVPTAGHLIGRRLKLEGRFNEPVTMEGVRLLGDSYEVRVRRGSGALDETILSASEVEKLLGGLEQGQPAVALANPHHLRLLVESARIRLAYAHDRQFAVSLSGIRTLPHQIEAVYEKMLPQPRLRFLRQPVRLTINEWLKARQLGESYWLYVVWDPTAPTRQLVTVPDAGRRLEHLAREVRSVSLVELPAEAIQPRTTGDTLPECAD